MIQHNINFEIIAMRASGISLMHCYVPIALVGLTMSLLTFFVSDYLLPRSSVGFIKLYQQILFSSPGLELEPYSVRRYQDSIIVSGDIDGNTIYQPLIVEPDISNSQRRIIAADSAQLLVKEDRGVLTLEMNDVVGHSHMTNSYSEYDYFNSDTIRYNVLLFELNIGVRTPTPREMRTVDIQKFLVDNQERVTSEENESKYELAAAQLRLQQVYYSIIDGRKITVDVPNSGGADVWAGVVMQMKRYINRIVTADNNFQPDFEYRIYETEYARKFSLASACFFLTIFAFPVGVRLRRSSWSIGFGIGLLAAVIFWCLLIGGQALTIQNRFFSPIFMMWLPNITLVAMGVLTHLFLRRTK